MIKSNATLSIFIVKLIYSGTFLMNMVSPQNFEKFTWEEVLLPYYVLEDKEFGKLIEKLELLLTLRV